MYQRTFLIVFRKSNTFVAKFLRLGFGHCFLVTYAGDQTVVIDPSDGGTGFYVVDKPVEKWIIDNCKKYTKMLTFTAKEHNLKGAKLKIFRNCVGYCKDFLGVNKLWIITPYQLCKYVSRETRR